MRFIILLIFFSCAKQDYTQDECEVLSMQAYRGLPRQAHLFSKHCGEYTELKYTKEVCQQALIQLSYSGSLMMVKKKFGDKIHHCFNKSDIENFTQDSKNKGSSSPKKPTKKELERILNQDSQILDNESKND